MHVCVCSVAKLCPTLHDIVGCRPLGSSVHLPGKNAEVGCHFLLQDLFLIQDWICISCIGKRILYHWATREALGLIGNSEKNWKTPWRKGEAISGCLNCSLLGKKSGSPALNVNSSSRLRKGYNHTLTCNTSLSAVIFSTIGEGG